MKKLMTAIAVAGLSAAVFGDVASANVVGYNTVEKSDDGCPMYFVASFDGVSAGGYFTLGQVKPVDNGCWNIYDGDSLATVDSNGCQQEGEMYTYDFDYGHWYLCDGSGVVDYDSGIKDGVQIYTNHGLLLTVTDDDVELQFSGEVQKGDAELYFDSASMTPTYTGNFTAKEVLLGGFVPNEFWNVYDGDNIATVDSNGCQQKDEQYTFDPDDGLGGNWYLGDGSGVVDYESGIKNSIPFPSNKGLIINVTDPDCTVSIPMPLPKAN